MNSPPCSNGGKTRFRACFETLILNYSDPGFDFGFDFLMPVLGPHPVLFRDRIKHLLIDSMPVGLGLMKFRHIYTIAVFGNLSTNTSISKRFKHWPTGLINFAV